VRNFDADVAAELAKEVLYYFNLIEFQFANTYCYTDRDASVFHGGNRYYPRSYKFNNIALSGSMSVDKVSISMDNTDRVFSGILLNEDVRNKPVIISFGVRVKPEGLPEEDLVETLFTGILAGWDIEGDSKVKIEVANEFILWNKKTLRKHAASCPWAFKGEECGYGGSAKSICDKSYDTCVLLGNQTHFGGFRFLPVIAEKEIWWGRTRG
jgi:hypothetical protein